MSNWASLHNHTHYSLRDAIAKPAKLASMAAERGYPAMAMTDHGNIGCAVDFCNAMDGVGVKPIIGCEFNICKQDAGVHTGENGPPYSHAIVLARNLAGWKQLISIVSRSSGREYTHRGPRIHREGLRQFAGDGNLIAITGHVGSDLANALFSMPKVAYSQHDRGEIRSKFIDKQGWVANTREIIESYISIFGRENVFLESQAGDLPCIRLVADAMRHLGKQFRLPVIATADVHYAEPGDNKDQLVVLCAGMNTTLTRAVDRVRSEKDFTIQTFFGPDSHYHLPTSEELGRYNTPGEIEATVRVAEMCDKYSITGQPRLPRFECPDGMSADAYLKVLCERGWNIKIEGRENTLSRPIQVYRDRLDMELGVISGAGLSSYFLVVQDFMEYGRKRDWILGPGRGSSSGCIISWLTGITSIDPVQYGLMFERFYNAGRNSPGKVSLPDIDSDFPKAKVDELYRYLQAKYGEDHVARIATFNSMQGKSALKEVMSVHGVPFDEANRITKIFPGKERISEELEEMRQRGEEPSIISYVLDVYKDELADFVQEGEDGTLTGPYGSLFAQARRLEGTKTHIGQHAAGVAIGAEPLAGVCPLKWDASVKANIAAMEWTALESIGIPKYDILVTAFLDKAHGVRSQLRHGRIFDDTMKEDAH